MFVTGRTLLLLFTSNTSIMSTLLPHVLNFRVCLWVRAKVLRTTLRSVEIWQEEYNPSLADRELVDMFLGTLFGPYFNHLIGSSSFGFTELIMTGERVEAGIKSGKIQKGASSSTEKKPFKKESSAVYSSRSQNRDRKSVV